MRWIERDTSNTVQHLASIFPVVMVLGARQTGKSSLLKHLYPDLPYRTFDDPAQIMFAEGSPAEFLAQFDGPVILDEVQYVPALFRYIKIAVDQDRRPGRFLLTGSQGYHIAAMGSESLAGRMGLVELSVLGASELASASIRENLESHVFRGGYPELWQKSIDPVDWFPSYISTYIQRDIRDLSQVADLVVFARFLRSVALRAASLMNYADLARDVGVSPNTIKNWVSVLVSSGVASLLEGWSPNPSSRLTKAPKLYFNDSGLLCALLGFRSPEAVFDSSLAGIVWETWAFVQVRTWLLNRGRLHNNLFYWRTKEGKEVDFLFTENNLFYALECKSKALPDKADVRTIASLRSSMPESVVYASILCRTPQFIPLAPGLDAAIDNGFNLHRIFQS